MQVAARVGAGVVVRGRRARATAHAQQAARRVHCRVLPVRRPRVRQHTRGPRGPRRHAGRQAGRRPHQREPDAAAQLPVARLVERHSGKVRFGRLCIRFSKDA